MRKLGWYWCQIKAPLHDWEPMRWDGNGFEMVGKGRTYYEGTWLESIEVGPRIPTPDEPRQSVPSHPNWDMLAADGCSKHHEGQECLHHENRKRIWSAMLKAAPSPGQEE